uniref:hypothetical protein n=1 Tax=Pseudomonas viridiflava TaxID=33069 RepID=UPI00197DA524
GQGLLDQLTNGVFHDALFDRKRGGAWMRGWKNSALSVAQALSPTVLVCRRLTEWAMWEAACRR